MLKGSDPIIVPLKNYVFKIVMIMWFST